MAMRPWQPIRRHPLATASNACLPACSPRLLPSVSLCYTIASSAAAGAAIVWRRSMFRSPHGRHRLTPSKYTRGACTTVLVLVGVLGLLACLTECTGPNPLERSRPPDALAWDGARLADSPFFYQRFL